MATSTLSTRDIRAVRRELLTLRKSPQTPEHVRAAAIKLDAHYRAVIDGRDARS
jgi:hypothetical protein